MPDVTPICWAPKRLSSSVYAAAFERSGISDGRINRQSARHQPVITLPGTRDPWDWAKFCRNGIDPVGVGVVGSLHIGRVISWNGIVTYGAMAMGAPLGVVFYHWAACRR